MESEVFFFSCSGRWKISECDVLGQISLIAVNVLSSRVSRASKDELACSWASYGERSKLTEVKSVYYKNKHLKKF